ncbi:hypothetical protein PVAND_010482 [Polypedilum vanderplanki]|uniref:G domain-containing protein n=1 Tax=Polypedilum vanderplanki TaxID=319348 RepID=A0A9J6CGR0_POLVA|nr:hypothetical protein PVAND_010482 [Polypedilum vanderplanki]
MHLLLRNLRFNIIRNYHRPSAEILTEIINRDNVNKKYAEALDEFQDKILYNSLLEIQKARIRKLDHITESQKKAQIRRNQEFGVEPLPLALKHFCDDQSANILEDKNDSIMHKKKFQNIVLPFSRYLKVEKSNEEEEKDTQTKENPENWMKDYELYDEAEDEIQNEYGTPDPEHPVSEIPCGGCGALLHCKDPSIPGYLPSEIFKDLSDDELKTVHCQRCHFLARYNTAISVSVKPEDYINIIASIKDESSLAIVMVDLLDFPCSIFPELSNVLGKTRPIILVGNKVDLIPRDSQNYLEHLKECLLNEAMKMGFHKKFIKHVALISAKTGYGVEELITKLHSIWKYKGNVYLIGCTNVGKSSLFNALLRSDYCKSEATNLIQRATASPWPGTTLKLLKFPILRPSDFRIAERAKRLENERSQRFLLEQHRKEQATDTKSIYHATLIGHIGQTFAKVQEYQDPVAHSHSSGFTAPILTLNENHEKYAKSKWCFDTPGVMHKDQILPLLTTDEIIKVLPSQMIKARVFFMKPGMSLFLAGLARVDFYDIPKLTRVIVFASLKLPISIVNTEDADEFYKKFLGSEVLGVPLDMSEERLEKWPKLEMVYDEVVIEGIDKHVSACDFVMSSAGWMGINLPKDTRGIFRAWILDKRGFHVRKPSILPHGFNLRGKRIRDTPAYKVGDAFTYRKVYRKNN